MQLEKTLNEDTERIYESSMRDIESRLSQTNIPKWVYLIFILLGWNEFVWVLKNPLLLPLVILAVTGFFFFSKMPDAAQTILIDTIKQIITGIHHFNYIYLHL